MTKICDNKSVGIIIQNSSDELLLIERAKFPFGLAAPAGHVDGHGSLEQTAIEEVNEETGLQIATSSLVKLIDARRIGNKCRRQGGDYHEWTVFKATEYAGNLNPSSDETNGAAWYSRPTLNTIAKNQIENADTKLEPIWLDFLIELEYIEY